MLQKRDFIKDIALSSWIKKLVVDDVGVVQIGRNKDDAPNDIDHEFSKFYEVANDFDFGLYQ